MNIAFIIFQGMTALDFIGVYDPVTRLKSMGFMPNLQWEICAASNDVWDERVSHPQSKGLYFKPTQVNESLSNYDVIIIPGGYGTRQLMKNDQFVEWLKTAQNCPLKVSVCTGSSLLAAAGFLNGRKATTHPSAFNELREFSEVTVVDERIVDQGEIITARGVTSSIDLGLYLCERLAGYEVKEKIRKQMDYPYGV
jgi:cyclohexyl-isocyanide hydratase